MAESIRDHLASLDKRRARLGITLRDLAEKMDTSGYGHLSRVFSGKHNTSLDYVSRIEAVIEEIEKARGVGEI